MPTWTFVRHGESVANAEGWLAGRLDSDLTARGQAEAQAAHAALVGAPLRRAFASDLRRATKTALLVLEGHDIPLVRTPALRERCCGAWSRRRIDGLGIGGQLDACLRGWTTRPPRGESLLEAATRATRWLACVDDDVDTLVVAHGALIRAVVGALDDAPRDRIGHWHPANCEIVQRRLVVGTWADLCDRLRSEARHP